jgi:hypothetical protein
MKNSFLILTILFLILGTPLNLKATRFDDWKESVYGEDDMYDTRVYDVKSDKKEKGFFDVSYRDLFYWIASCFLMFKASLCKNNYLRIGGVLLGFGAMMFFMLRTLFFFVLGVS